MDVASFLDLQKALRREPVHYLGHLMRTKRNVVMLLVLRCPRCKDTQVLPTLDESKLCPRTFPVTISQPSKKSDVLTVKRIDPKPFRVLPAQSKASQTPASASAVAAPAPPPATPPQAAPPHPGHGSGPQQQRQAQPKPASRSENGPHFQKSPSFADPVFAGLLCSSDANSVAAISGVSKSAAKKAARAAKKAAEEKAKDFSDKEALRMQQVHDLRVAKKEEDRKMRQCAREVAATQAAVKTPRARVRTDRSEDIAPRLLESIRVMLTSPNCPLSLPELCRRILDEYAKAQKQGRACVAAAPQSTVASGGLHMWQEDDDDMLDELDSPAVVDMDAALCSHTPSQSPPGDPPIDPRFVEAFGLLDPIKEVHPLVALVAFLLKLHSCTYGEGCLQTGVLAHRAKQGHNPKRFASLLNFCREHRDDSHPYRQLLCQLIRQDEAQSSIEKLQDLRLSASDDIRGSIDACIEMLTPLANPPMTDVVANSEQPSHAFTATELKSHVKLTSLCCSSHNCTTCNSHNGFARSNPHTLFPCGFYAALGLKRTDVQVPEDKKAWLLYRAVPALMWILLPALLSLHEACQGQRTKALNMMDCWQNTSLKSQQKNLIRGSVGLLNATSATPPGRAQVSGGGGGTRTLRSQRDYDFPEDFVKRTLSSTCGTIATSVAYTVARVLTAICPSTYDEVLKTTAGGGSAAQTKDKSGGKAAKTKSDEKRPGGDMMSLSNMTLDELRYVFDYLTRLRRKFQIKKWQHILRNSPGTLDADSRLGKDHANTDKAWRRRCAFVLAVKELPFFGSPCLRASRLAFWYKIVLDETLPVKFQEETSRRVAMHSLSVAVYFTYLYFFVRSGQLAPPPVFVPKKTGKKGAASRKSKKKHAAPIATQRPASTAPQLPSAPTAQRPASTADRASVTIQPTKRHVSSPSQSGSTARSSKRQKVTNASGSSPKPVLVSNESTAPVSAPASSIAPPTRPTVSREAIDPARLRELDALLPSDFDRIYTSVMAALAPFPVARPASTMSDPVIESTLTSAPVATRVTPPTIVSRALVRALYEESAAPNSSCRTTELKDALVRNVTEFVLMLVFDEDKFVSTTIQEHFCAVESSPSEPASTRPASTESNQLSLVPCEGVRVCAASGESTSKHKKALGSTVKLAFLTRNRHSEVRSRSVCRRYCLYAHAKRGLINSSINLSVHSWILKVSLFAERDISTLRNQRRAMIAGSNDNSRGAECVKKATETDRSCRGRFTSIHREKRKNSRKRREQGFEERCRSRGTGASREEVVVVGAAVVALVESQISVGSAFREAVEVKVALELFWLQAARLCKLIIRLRRRIASIASITSVGDVQRARHARHAVMHARADVLCPGMALGLHNRRQRLVRKTALLTRSHVRHAILQVTVLHSERAATVAVKHPCPSLLLLSLSFISPNQPLLCLTGSLSPTQPR